MSDRPLLAPNLNKPIIGSGSSAVVSGDMSANITGPATVIQRLPGLSYDLVWTGTPTGTFTVQVSNTYAQGADGKVIAIGNWKSLPTSAFSGTYPVASGSAGSGFLDLVGTSAYAVRLLYNFTSGTGTLTVVPCAKVL